MPKQSLPKTVYGHMNIGANPPYAEFALTPSDILDMSETDEEVAGEYELKRLVRVARLTTVKPVSRVTRKPTKKKHG